MACALWIVLLGLSGWCVQEGRSGPPATSTRITLHPRDSGRAVRLKPGQWLAVQLPAYSASGYRCWLLDPAAELLDVEQVPARIGGTQSWVFRATRNGQGSLLFECRQDLSESPAQRVEFGVRSP